MNNFLILYIKYFKFIFISGIGLCLDLLLYLILLSLGVRALYANIASATFGVSFSYFISANHIFRYDGKRFSYKYIAYLVYNMISIFSFSVIIETIANIAKINPIITKCMITPFTMMLNYLVLNILLVGHSVLRQN